MTFYFSPVHEKGYVLQGRRTHETQPRWGKSPRDIWRYTPHFLITVGIQKRNKKAELFPFSYALARFCFVESSIKQFARNQDIKKIVVTETLGVLIVCLFYFLDVGQMKLLYKSCFLLNWSYLRSYVPIIYDKTKHQFSEEHQMTQNSVPGIQNPRRGIRNSRLS